MRIIYLWRFGFCGFYNPYLHCLNEYLHLWDKELGINGWYILPMAIHSLVLVRYSVVFLGIECLLWLRLSLMSVHYALH